MPILRVTLVALFVGGGLAAIARAQNPLAKTPPAPLFAGEFQGKGIALELTYAADTKSYAGTLTFEGQRYACSATETDKKLAGRFQVGPDAFAFTATRAGDKLTVVSDGSAYELVAQNVAPAPRNPLGGRGKPTEPDPAGRDQGRLDAPRNEPATPPNDARETPAPNNLQPAPAATGLPAWMKNGTRLTFYTGSATLPSVSSVLEEDEQGNWVDRNGRRFSAQDVQGSAGGGYTQYDLAHVGSDAIAAHMSTFVFADAQLRSVVLVSAQGLVGDRNALSDLWVHPSRLAAMQEQEVRGYRVRRLQYPLQGRTYNAITIQTTTDAGYSRSTYDLDTGVLLAMSSSTVGRPVYTPGAGGTANQAAGVTTIASVYLMSVRDLNLPWAQQAQPRWLQGGQRLTYRGTTRNSLAEGLPPWGFEALVDVERVSAGFATGKITSRIDYGGGATPQESPSARVFGPGMMGPLSIDPAVLRRLQPGQVLDEDKVTGRRASVVGGDETYLTLGETGPLDNAQWTYDLRSGMLVGFAAQQQQGPAVISVDARLQNPR